MEYLYIFEDGLLGLGGSPTETDLECVEQGTLEIIHLATKIRLLHDRKRQKIDICHISEEEPGEPYHSVYF